MSRRSLAIFTALALLGAAAESRALTVLTVGKQATFKAEKARIRIGRDPRLQPLGDPQCGGIETRVQLASYPQATARLVAQEEVTLPCEHWRQTRKGYVYEDETGTAGGVTKVVYSANGLQVQLAGPNYTPLPGPVGYAEMWFTVDTTRFLARFHNFTKNTATELVAMKASKPAGEGEAAFWEVLLGDDKSDANQLLALELLGKAANKNRKDGRSPFLCGMMHLYRYGLFMNDAGQPTDASRTEIDLANEAFAVALPRLWDGSGDSRVPGFIATAKFARGYAHGDDALMNEGIADLQAAVEINAFFNVFDLIPVIQALPPADPRWQQAFDDVTAYLENPETLPCVTAQPEICANAGFAPRNFGGSLVLFGDVYAKAGDVAQATTWYNLAKAVGGTPESPWPFQHIADERVLDVQGRVDLYLDGDPGNDPPIIGIQEENCASCHNR